MKEQLFNPNNIEGILIWKSGRSIEIAKGENQAFQEYPKSVELWEQLPDGRILRVQRWLKKTVTHFLINNEFVLSF